MSDSEFKQLIKKPDQFFDQIVEGVKHDLRAIPVIDGDPRLQKMLSKVERHGFQESVFTNMGFSKPVAVNFMKSALGLPKMGASVYSHLWAGLTNYVLEKKGLPMDPTREQLESAIHLAPYYRSPLLIEEFWRMGYSSGELREIVAKAFFMQYWSGDYGVDPLMLNPMIRTFYPMGRHISTSANDLGREIEFQSAKLCAMGLDGIQQPLTILNAGDTAPFTDGAMSTLQHVMEASERGVSMPIIFLVNANNSAISARLSGDAGDALKDAEEGVQRIKQRFDFWGELMNPGFVTQAEDVVEGVQMMRDAVDQVLATGRPTYCISSFPFRPLGHASDGSPANDALLLAQFHKFKDTLTQQICSACDPGTPGADVAAALEDCTLEIEDKIAHALKGTKIMQRPEIEEYSIPGITEIKKEPGQIYDLPSGYLLNKGMKSFDGLGADVFGKTLSAAMTKLEEAGRNVRYIHQENHTPNKTDTRGGVYGELNQVSEHHLRTKFVSLLPNEAQIAELGAGFRASQGPDSVVFVKGPHTLFNEHAKDHMKYAAFRHTETGEKTGHIYLCDGGNLCSRERENITLENGQVVERDLVMARVGEHHNTPYYNGYMADANTVLAVPVDMNFFRVSLPNMIDLQTKGRMVMTFLPTSSFGLLHPSLPKGVFPDSGVTQNDIIRVNFPGRKPRNGKNLVVVTWGPDSKWIASTLAQEGIEATMFILSYIRAPNSLVRHLDEVANTGVPTEVVAVDPNPEAGLIAPIMEVVKQKLLYPDSLFFSSCFVEPAFVPCGLGENLLAAKDLLRLLSMRGLIEGFHEARQVIAAGKSKNQAPLATTSTARSAGGVEIVMAPLDGEGVVVSYKVKVGDAVKAGDVVAEVESDKASVDIEASAAGTLQEFFVKAGEEINVTTDTKICSILSSGSAVSSPDVWGASAGGEEVVMAPLDGEGVVVTFKVSVGDAVNAGDIIAEVESDKATVEIEAPVTGTLSEFLVMAGEEMNVTTDTKICCISADGSGSSTERAPSSRDMLSSVWEAPMHQPQQVVREEASKHSKQAAGGADHEVTALSRVQLAMVDNMTVKVGDTKVFTISETILFQNLLARKTVEVSPAALLVHSLANAVQTAGLNKKLSEDRRCVHTYSKVDIGVAVEVKGLLRVAVVRDAAAKSATQIAADLAGFRLKGAKLTHEDQDLTSVCYVLTSLGKDAPQRADATLPRGLAGILAIGRSHKPDGATFKSAGERSHFTMTLCHATLTGSEGAKLLREVKTHAEAPAQG